MFDFEKLDVYKKAKVFNSCIREFIKNTRLDNATRDQLRRAAFISVLNLAEGSGRFTQPAICYQLCIIIKIGKLRSWTFCCFTGKEIQLIAPVKV